MMLRILTVHNHYQNPGGEDFVYAGESALLEKYGHSISRYEEDNGRVHSGAATGLLAAWNQKSYQRLRSSASVNTPDIADFHNTFPLISPSAYYAMRRERIPVVQKISNFRLLCPSANFIREGRVCEECLEKRSFRPAIQHRCYRSSVLATGAVAAMLTVHRAAQTWERMVDVYVALSEFSRSKLIEGGFPSDRIVVKPNFVASDPGPGAGARDFALFVGRLSEEKGIRTLATAWTHLSDIPLRVVGDGSLRKIDWPAGVNALGALPRESVFELMQQARILIFPSICYENAPLTLAESFACGLPAIASNLGSMPEFVDHMRTGLLFRPGDAEDLAAKVRWAWEHPEELPPMRAAARREYEQKYTAERGYRMLMNIYELAIENARRRERDATGRSA